MLATTQAALSTNMNKYPMKMLLQKKNYPILRCFAIGKWPNGACK